MDREKIRRKTEESLLYLLLKDRGWAISLEQFKVLCDTAKKAAKDVVEQELKQEEQ